MLGYVTIFRSRERHFHFHKITLITTAPSLTIQYLGLHISRMITLQFGKSADVKHVTHFDEPCSNKYVVAYTNKHVYYCNLSLSLE
jgi:hypothetical protein